MSGMYPNEKIIEIFGEQVKWPGLGPDGKFTNGSFSDPLIKPSFIPAGTLNLLLDNMQQVITAAGLNPNNIEPDQLLRALQVLIASGGGITVPAEHEMIEFFESGTFTVPEGVTKITVTACGGGGGGASKLGVPAGGGADAIMDQVFAVTPGATLAITVGKGGKGGAAGAAGAGSAGSNTIIGQLITLPGGGGNGTPGGPGGGSVGNPSLANNDGINGSGGGVSLPIGNANSNYSGAGSLGGGGGGGGGASATAPGSGGTCTVPVGGTAGTGKGGDGGMPNQAGQDGDGPTGGKGGAAPTAAGSGGAGGAGSLGGGGGSSGGTYGGTSANHGGGGEGGHGYVQIKYVT
jgi:hypothetical protein